ncbi:MAG: 2-oxoglutarate dehydrogenase E1 component [Proteobacteria bacterium]|nr:2-oxoglutarate dehydrogenase E1 component [Pseudomonadota bacterium]
MSASNLKQTTYAASGNSVYIAELYEQYLTNPASVDASWQEFFGGLGDNAANISKDFIGAGRQIVGYREEIVEKRRIKGGRRKGDQQAAKQGEDASSASIRAHMLIRAFRVRGHLLAKLDPLGLEVRETHLELDPKHYGFSDADWDKPIYIGGWLGMENATLRQIVDALKATYCGNIGAEFIHVVPLEQKEWLENQMESTFGKPVLSKDDKKKILDQIVKVEGFEQFLHVKFPGTKRFSIEGAESLIPALETMVEVSARLGVQDVVVGMPHRGRLNVLTAFMGKPYYAMLSEFQGNKATPDDIESSGDVKYHLGTSSDRNVNGKVVHMSLTANPSHLEAVNPVVMGKVRAKQDQLGDTNRDKVMAVLLHGDAAFAGQGVVAESLSLSDLTAYAVGGVFHIIVNNQIGFTTSPKNARLSPYPSDVAKTVQAPIFHVNGDDPEAVIHATRIISEYRHKFKKDVVLDIFCYRRHGHNEGDEPMFTQPVMYNTIGEHMTPRDVYAKKLMDEGTLSMEEFEKMKRSWHDFLEKEYDAAKKYKPNKADWLEGKWKGFEKPKNSGRTNVDTGVDIKTLKKLGKHLSAKPEGVVLNKKIERLLEAKAKMFETGEGFDWATGEALAFGSLLLEGTSVRLTGQDVVRGTFSHRHSGLVDQTNDNRYFPLKNLDPKQARFEVYDSNLSEFAVLGFEYGYSLAEPNSLTLWEAQFGDFVNGAQVIIDQFISSGESKWLRMSGLCMLLPHGYEGQGPEHSSARLERFLQSCAEDNMQVVNITTPANYFHALRRQIVRKFRKPMIVMSPKSLLRHKLAQSTLSEFEKGNSFKRIIGETQKLVAGDKVRKVIYCSGKVYYDLFEEREKRGINDIAIVRIEQLYPFSDAEVAEEAKKYKNAEVIWCQEEPKNMGAWTFINPLIEEALIEAKHKNARPRYVGRPAAASPAVGYMKMHTEQLNAFLNDALGK